jgi:hypothetical protein
MQQINKILVVEMYKNGSSMRNIALKFNTNHKLISRILKGFNVNTREPLMLRCKRKFECDNELRYNNMATHLRFDVTFDFLMQYKDFDKLKLLNDVITRKTDRFNTDTEWYKKYLFTFYYDINFNIIYQNWINSKFDKYMKPSLDHIIPKSKKGTNDIENLQFLTWFENRCKNDMSKKEWDNLKQNITNYFI